MLLIILFMIGLRAQLSVAEPNTMHINWIDADVVFVDEEYFNSTGTSTEIMEIDDRLKFFFNVTYIKKLPLETWFHVAEYGLTMAKFRSPTGIDEWISFCGILINDGGYTLFTAMFGITKENCPPEPGTFRVSGYDLPESSPAYVLNENKYMRRIQIVTNNKVILTFEIMKDVTLS